MEDVVIVGGGLAGLATAGWCARAGLRVRVLERARELGGRARTEVHAGHAFNQGGHALYAQGAAARGLRDLGVAFSGRSPAVGGMLASVQGSLHRLPSGLVSMLATDLFGFAAKLDAARALATIARTDPRPLRDVTWEAWVERLTPRPEAREALGGVARLTTYGNAPKRASAGATIAQIQSGAGPGVLYLDGGWQTLVDGLERVARARGAVLTGGAHVESVRREQGRIVVGRADAEPVEARAVVLATGPATARTLLGQPALGADLITLRAACLDVGLKALPRPDRLFTLGLDRPTYFSVHSARARLAETGATVHLMKYLDPDEPADPRADERELEGVLDLAQPGWRDLVRTRRYLPSLVASNALVAAQARRPAVDAAAVDGVFLAGDWVGEEGMLADASVASAREAAARVVAVLGRGRAQAPKAAATMATA